jgi:hypothetical protein
MTLLLTSLTIFAPQTANAVDLKDPSGTALVSPFLKNDKTQTESLAVAKSRIGERISAAIVAAQAQAGPPLAGPQDNEKYKFKTTLGTDGTQTGGAGESCGNSESNYKQVCNINVIGVKFQEFPNFGTEGYGNSYSSDRSSPNERPQFGFNVTYEGYQKLCRTKTTIQILVDPTKPKGPTKPKDSFIINDCSVGPKQVWVPPIIGKVVRPGTPNITENGATTEIGKSATCQGKFKYNGGSTTDVNGNLVSYDVTLPDNSPYEANYVGYRVNWRADTTVGVEHNFDTYTCLLPSAAKLEVEDCLITLDGTIEATIPSPPTDWKPPVTEGVKVIASLSGKKNTWTIKKGSQLTKYGERLQDAPADRTFKGADDLDACRTSRTTKWNFPERFSRWGYGQFDTNLSATYHRMTVVHFTSNNVFGGAPKDKVVDVDKTVRTRDISNPGTGNGFWRSIIYRFCQPKATSSSEKVGVTEAVYLTEDKFFWLDFPIDVNDLAFSALDCAEGFNPTPLDYNWACNDPGLKIWGGVGVNSNVRALQTQADNKRRDAVFGRPTPRSTTGQLAIRNIENRTLVYETLTDASPRLTGTSTREQQPGVNQPFTFKFGPKAEAQGVNNLWTVVGDKFDANGNLELPAWSNENLTLATTFREASREGKDFPIRPVYGFDAEFLLLDTNIVSYSPVNGNLITTQTEKWIPQTVICPSPWIAIDAKRVGVVPG